MRKYSRFVKAGTRVHGMTCVECGKTNQKGRIWRDRFRWMVRLDCGDDKEIGLTLPFDELERRKLINQTADDLDPRLKERQKHALHEFYEREFEKIYRLLMGVSHWMDTAGLVRHNPCYKRSVRDIDKWKKLSMNQEEFKEVYFGILRILDQLKKQAMLRNDEQKRLQRIAESSGGGKKITRSKTHLSDDQQEWCDGMGVRVREEVETHNLLGITTPERET